MQGKSFLTLISTEIMLLTVLTLGKGEEEQRSVTVKQVLGLLSVRPS